MATKKQPAKKTTDKKPPTAKKEASVVEQLTAK